MKTRRYFHAGLLVYHHHVGFGQCSWDWSVRHHYLCVWLIIHETYRLVRSWWCCGGGWCCSSSCCCCRRGWWSKVVGCGAGSGGRMPWIVLLVLLVLLLLLGIRRMMNTTDISIAPAGVVGFGIGGGGNSATTTRWQQHGYVEIWWRITEVMMFVAIVVI